MASSNVSWGIEIGAGGVRAVKLAADGDNLRVDDFITFDHPKVLSTPELDQDDALRVAVGMLASRYDLSGAQISISVPGHQSFARFAKLPPVEPKKIPDIVKFEAVQQIPFPLEEVEWDYQTFVSPDSPEVEVGIFAVTRQRIMERLTMLEDVGITPDVATLSPIAVYNAFAHDLDFTETSPGTILLDIGTMATDLVIAHSGRVWVRTFPIGGHQFTEALVDTFKLPYSKAEKLKREAEQTKHARHVFQAMRPVFTDLVQEVQRSIGYYQSLHPNSELKRLIGVGSTFRLPGLRKYLKQQLQLDVYRLEQFKKINVDGSRASDFQSASLNLVTAYGLALQGLGMATLNANLMPVKLVRDAMWKRKIGWFGAAAAVAAVASAAMFIRPMIDKTAITAAGKPTAFDQALNEANAAKARAQSAGVLGADSATTVNAQAMIQLFDTKEIYGRIVNDVGEMLAKSQEIAKGAIPAGAPAYVVHSVTTDYIEPQSDSSSRTGSEFSQPSEVAGAYGGANPAWLQGRQGRNTRTSNTDVPEEIKDRHVIRVQMQVTTAHPQPQEFMLGSIEAWLKQNKSRPDVPYEIALPGNAVTFTRISATNTASPGGARPPTPFRNSPSEFVGGPPTGALPSGVRPGAPVYQPTGPDRQRSGPIDLDRVAPIVPPADSGPPETGSFDVVWYVVLDPKKAEGGDS